jgi:hypothetical protein
VIGSSTLEAPDQTTIAEFSITPIGEPDPEWGRLQKVSLVTVVDVPDTLAQFQVSDGTHQGWIKVIDGTGVQMPQVGEYLSITGVRDRFSLNGPGCLIPRKSSDIQRNPQNYQISHGLIKPGWNLISVPADPANPDPLWFLIPSTCFIPASSSGRIT